MSRPAASLPLDWTLDELEVMRGAMEEAFEGSHGGRVEISFARAFDILAVVSDLVEAKRSEGHRRKPGAKRQWGQTAIEALAVRELIAARLVKTLDAAIGAVRPDAFEEWRKTKSAGAAPTSNVREYRLGKLKQDVPPPRARIAERIAREYRRQRESPGDAPPPKARLEYIRLVREACARLNVREPWRTD